MTVKPALFAVVALFGAAAASAQQTDPAASYLQQCKICHSFEPGGRTLVGPDLPDGSLRISYEEIERARTIFEWGPQPKRVRG